MIKNATSINSDNPIDKITELVIKGLKSENEELFTKRICVLFTNNADNLNMLVNGIPIKATITDNEKLCELIKDCVEISDIKIDNSFNVAIYYKKRIIRWFETQEKADSSEYQEGESRASEKNKVSKEVITNKNITTANEDMMKYIEVEYL